MALGRTGNVASTALAAAAALLLCAAAISGYFVHAILDEDQFADRAASALRSEAVGDEVGTRVAAGLVRAHPDLVGVQPLLQAAFSATVRSGAFADLFALSVRDLHRSLFDRDSVTLTLTLFDIGATARGVLEVANPQLAAEVAAREDVSVLTQSLPALAEAGIPAADDLRALRWILLVLAVASMAGSIWLAPNRRRVVLVFGASALLAGVVGFVLLRGIEVLVVERLAPGGERDAAKAIWDAFFRQLGIALLAFSAAGTVIAAASSATLRDPDSPASRRPTLAGLGRPEQPWPRLAWALALILAGGLIVFSGDTFVELLTVLFGLYIAYAGAVEVFRVTNMRGAVGEPASGGRTLIAALGVAALIVLGGFVFLEAGGLDPDPAPLRIEGCNGSIELCEASLTEVAIPMTHNSMSAANDPDYLFAQQDRGIGDQLRDGIRGLMIDAYYGQPTESGKILTDLSGQGGGAAKGGADQLSPEALAAAFRVRKSILSSPPTGPRGVYLCHTLCEVGAVPIEESFGEIRDFMAADPDEVLVIIVEDYVRPESIAAAADQTGLDRFIYRGSVEPLPTLAEMVESGGRVLFLAENNGGDGPDWYHSAYDRLVQETPFLFRQPRQLIEPAELPESCRPFRGAADAPLFLLNHWIDTSPTPRPSNAARVNSADVLGRRIERCESDRGAIVNPVSVDFYRQGDLFEVTDRLNGIRVPAP